MVHWGTCGDCVPTGKVTKLTEFYKMSTHFASILLIDWSSFSFNHRPLIRGVRVSSAVGIWAKGEWPEASSLFSSSHACYTEDIYLSTYCQKSLQTLSVTLQGRENNSRIWTTKLCRSKPLRVYIIFPFIWLTLLYVSIVRFLILFGYIHLCPS